MKTIYKSIMLAALAATAFTSCSIREMGAPEVPANRIAVTVNASFAGTKTVFGTPADGKIPVSWSETGEILALAEISNGVRTQIDTVDAYSVENGGANAKFQFNLVQGEAASYDYVAVYPSSLFRATPGKTTPAGAVFDFAFSIDPQVPTATSPDPAACLMFSKVSGLTAQPTELNMAFEHMCGYGKVSIKDVKLAAGETIESLLLQFPATDTTGARIGYMPDGSLKYETGVSSTLTIKTDNLETAGGSFDAWFATRPFVFKSGENATVSIVTDKRTFKKEITAPADLSFEAGVATAFAVDMSTAEAPEIFKADLELVFDFSTAQTTLPDWPTDKTANGEYVYPLNGTDYSFYLGATFAAAAQLTVNAAKSYLGLPVVKGHKLTRVVLNSIKGGTKYIGAISADTAGANIVKGGEQQTWTAAGAHTYALEETVADTRYYVYGVGPLPINKITLYYDKDGEAEPEGPQPYEFPEFKPAFKTILNIMLSNEVTAAAGTASGPATLNGTFDGSKMTFAAGDTTSVGGATIERIGGNIAAAAGTLGTQTPYCSCFVTKGWDQAGAAYLYTTPAPEDLSGTICFLFSISSTKFAELTKWEVTWSTDGENFSPVDYLETIINGDILSSNSFKLSVSTHQSCRTVAEFTPSAKIAKGSNLYVKVACTETTADAASTARCNVGSAIYSKIPETTFETSDNIVLAENFSNCKWGFDAFVGCPLYYFGGVNGNTVLADQANGFTGTAKMYVRRGCVGTNAKTGAEYITTPALAKLSGTADVMLTFKAGLVTGADLTQYPDGIKVTATTEGTEVGELVWDSPLESDYYNWHVCHVLVKNATPETKLNIGNIDAVENCSCFFLDDVVVTK